MATEIIPDIIVKRGDTLRRNLRLDAREGVLDFTGCVARMHLRNSMDELLADFTPYLTLDNVAPDPAEPWVKYVRLDVPYDVMLVAPGLHRSDLEITWADGSRGSSRTLYVKVEQDQTYV